MEWKKECFYLQYLLWLVCVLHKGIEFAVGPNLSLGGIAMVFGAGYNFKFGKLNVPVNIAYVPSMNKTYNHDARMG